MRLDERMKLEEKTRQELIAKSKSGANYVASNQTRGKNRWERRRYSQIAASVAEYNRINMDDLFKKDVLKFSIKVNGETNLYHVTVRFDGAINEIAHQIKMNRNKLEFKTVLISLTRMFNAGDIYVSCDCADFKYRFAYVANKDGYDASDIPELRPADIRNPDDDKGAGCKHINLVLANVDWIYKVSSVVHNYINYCKDNMENNYARYIFPKLYGMDYNKAIQMSLFDFDAEGNEIDTLASDEETINLSNAIGKRRGLFRKDVIVNNQHKFQKKEPVETDQLSLFNKKDIDNVNPNGQGTELKFGRNTEQEVNPNIKSGLEDIEEK